MIPLARIIIYGLIISYSTYVMASCQWRNRPNGQVYCSRPTDRIHTYEITCISTVSYDNYPDICTDPQNGKLIDDNHKINIYLENPEENPFLQDATFYAELTIHDGYLVTVPKDVYNMTKLTVLTITGNKLRKINFNDFLPIRSLKRINLANNTIIVLEAAENLSSYSTVQDIDVSYNFIETVPNNFIRRFSELEHLNMSHNMISSIGKHAFEGTIQLKTLDLSHNNLQEVGNIFTQLPRLIDSNYATSKNLQKLSMLVLDDNFITNVNFTEFFDTGIPELSIGANRIPCNELGTVKYSKFSEKFNRIVTAKILNFNLENINGISCQDVQDDIKDIINVSNNPNSNSSVLVSLLKNAIEKNSKSVETLFEIVNQNQKKIEQFIESTKSVLLSVNHQLTDIRNNIPHEPVTIETAVEYQAETSSFN